MATHPPTEHDALRAYLGGLAKALLQARKARLPRERAEALRVASRHFKVGSAIRAELRSLADKQDPR